MVTNITLSEDNFEFFAMNNYNNPQCCDLEEFYEDLKRFKYIKRLIGRYVQQDELRERLIINHLTIIFNVFGPEASRKMLLHKFPDSRFWPVLKPFLLLLSFLPEDEMVDIAMDPFVVERLRKI